VLERGLLSAAELGELIRPERLANLPDPRPQPV
jgi:hypothetical protein